jgi:hypothetical protein
MKRVFTVKKFSSLLDLEAPCSLEQNHNNRMVVQKRENGNITVSYQERTALGWVPTLEYLVTPRDRVYKQLW